MMVFREEGTRCQWENEGRIREKHRIMFQGERLFKSLCDAGESHGERLRR